MRFYMLQDPTFVHTAEMAFTAAISTKDGSEIHSRQVFLRYKFIDIWYYKFLDNIPGIFINFLAVASLDVL